MFKSRKRSVTVKSTRFSVYAFKESVDCGLLSSFAMIQTCTYLHPSKYSPRWGWARNRSANFQ